MNAHRTQHSRVTPAVSVIMPVHCGQQHLESAILSLLNQTFKDFELIAVENGSTDSSLSILQRLAQLDDRIRVLQSASIGSSLAMNLGIESARAPWIARLDQDDLALPDRLERQLAFLRDNPDVVAVSSWGNLIGETGKTVGITRLGPASREEFEARYAKKKPIYLLTPASMFSAELARLIGGFREAYFPADDIDFWSRLAAHGPILAIQEPLLSYRVHARSTSTTRLMEHMQKTRWAAENLQRRRAGLPELDLSHFASKERQQFIGVRLRRSVVLRSQSFYRRAGGLLSAGKPVGLVWLAASVLLDPALVLKRLRQQRVPNVLIREARRSWTMR